jgi:2-amino-4-hydroxy-6-hydroxymethyldihydropteridine diphosphokinase
MIQLTNRQDTLTPLVFIGLGSNIEPRREYLLRAVDFLKSLAVEHLVKQSPVIETEPLEMNDHSGSFLNQVVSFRCQFSAIELLQELKSIEKEMGRTSKGERRARTIDLDLLLFGNELINSEELIVPHPEMTKRAFVLGPLLALAPDLVHPGTGKLFADYYHHGTNAGATLSGVMKS